MTVAAATVNFEKDLCNAKRRHQRQDQNQSSGKRAYFIQSDISQ
jgi:hypothetical protein